MNYSPQKFWTLAPIRRFVSLFITVIWLATALQPCVMASFVDSNASKVETHHSSHASDDDSGDSVCAHCRTTSSENKHCESEPDSTCDNNDSYVNNGRIKPVDHEQFHKQDQAMKLLVSPGNVALSRHSGVSETGKSLPLPPGPALTDLYRVYLK